MSMSGHLLAIGQDEAESFAEMDPEEFVAKFLDGLILEKAWNAVGWLIQRCAVSTNPVLGGDVSIGEDFGYGPLIYFSPGRVGALRAELDALDRSVLSAHFDPAALAADDVYPHVWDRPDEADENREWIVDACEDLIGLYRTGCDEGLGVLVWIG